MKSSIITFSFMGSLISYHVCNSSFIGSSSRKSETPTDQLTERLLAQPTAGNLLRGDSPSNNEILNQGSSAAKGLMSSEAWWDKLGSSMRFTQSYPADQISQEHETKIMTPTAWLWLEYMSHGGINYLARWFHHYHLRERPTNRDPLNIGEVQFLDNLLKAYKSINSKVTDEFLLRLKEASKAASELAANSEPEAHVKLAGLFTLFAEFTEVEKVPVPPRAKAIEELLQPEIECIREKFPQGEKFFPRLMCNALMGLWRLRVEDPKKLLDLSQ